MGEAIAIVRDDLVLKWCYTCGFYEWAARKGNRFVCTRCGRVIQDWATSLLYKNNDGVLRNVN